VVSLPALEYESGLVDDLDVQLVVVKRGSEGATLVGHQGRVDVPAEPVPVIDVIGAGDALCAGLRRPALRPARRPRPGGRPAARNLGGRALWRVSG